MGDYNIIEYGYNIADETINFGTRPLADGDNLYEASTLATLRCEPSDSCTDTHFKAKILKNQIYFSINNSLRIFKDKECSELVCNVAFDSIIDTFCLSGNDELLFVGLRNGTVYLIDCNNQHQIVETYNTLENIDFSNEFFINSFVEDTFNVLAVTNCGKVYRINVESPLKLVLIHDFQCKITLASLNNHYLLVNGNKLAVLDLEDSSLVEDSGVDLKIVCPLNRMFITLDREGNLLRICPNSLVIAPFHNETKYKDLIFLSDSNNHKQLIALKDSLDDFYLELISYSQFETIYSIKVPSKEVFLVFPESLDDEVLYVSKITNEMGENELRFHKVYETEPERRLFRLLKKQRFEEAESFAETFKLNPQIIKKYKAQMIVDKTICDSKDISELINLLNSIDDDEFKINCCHDVESSCENFADIKKILDYGCKLVPKSKQENRHHIDEIQKSVIHLMFRFETFMALNQGTDYQMQDWLQFAGCDYIEELKGFLRNFQIEEAKIIYSRLDDTSTSKLNESQISDILNILNNLPVEVYQPFLPTFIPITLQILPATLTVFVKWIHNKVFHLEKKAKSDFPKNAISFTEKILKLMRVENIFDMLIQRQCTIHSDSINELSLLITSLKSLQILQDEYRISIPVRSYLSGPQNVIRTLLNIEMCPEDYNAFLKEFLLKYMLENHLEPNEILLDEIIDVTKYEEKYWIHIVGSILSCISSVPIKLQAVKKILDSATVPWGDSVKRIANDVLKYSHPLVSEIREMIIDEPVQVVLRKPKYKIKEKRVNDINDLKFVVNRIIYCNEQTMVEDILRLSDKSTEFKHEINMLLIQHFIRTGDLEIALQILDNNTPEEILICSNKLATSIEAVVNHQGRVPELRENYYSFSKAVFKRLSDNTTENLFEEHCIKETLKCIQNCYDLSKNFNMYVTSNDLRKQSHKNRFADDILDQICEDFENNKQSAEDIFSKCYKLACSLSMNKNDVLLKFCTKLEDYNIIFKSGLRIYETETSSRNLCLMAILLLKYVGTYKIQINANDDSFSDSESFIVTDTDNLCDNDVFLKGLQLSEKLVAKGIVLADPVDLSACMEVVNWVNVSFYCTHDYVNSLKKLIFGNMYESSAILPGYLTFATIKTVFNSFCNFISQFNNPHISYMAYYSSEIQLSEEQLFSVIKNLSNTLENLCKEGQHFTAFKIVSVLQSSLQNFAKNINPEVLIYLYKILQKQAIPKLLQVVISNPIVDSELFYNLLLACEPDDAIKIVQNNLRMYKRHPRKFYCISQIGIKLWNHLKKSSGKSGMQNAMLTVKWWKKFEKNRLNYDNFFRTGAAQRLEMIMNCENFEIDVIKDYCTDFQLDLIMSYSIYLKRCLCNWKPDYQIKTDVANNKNIIVKNDEDVLYKKCIDIIKIINDDAHILSLIDSIWCSVNNYYYEVFITMLNILDHVDPTKDNSKKVLMLIFLKNYQRVSKPSEAETEQWYSAFPDTQTLDPLSEFRLPFTQSLFTKNIWNIIRPEMNLKTYNLWFGAIKINEEILNKDDICSYVAKEVIASGVISKDKDENQWILYPKYEDLFDEIDQCIKHISSLERATSVAYYIMTHTPSGADQVNAAKLAHKYAIEYRKSSPGSSDVETAFIKVEKKYFSFATTHILHTYQLAEEKYVNLVAQPNDLIVNLYQDERILRKSELLDLYCPDINKAANAISELYSLDIGKIRHDLVNNWLLDYPSSIDLDSSIICTQNGTSSDEDNLKRAAYLCSYNINNKRFWQRYLLKIGLDNESEEQKSVSSKIKALKLFAMITDVEEIVAQTETTYDELMYYIDKLTIVHNLQYLGVALDIENLDKYNKRELLTRLVQRAGNLLAIKTMAIICMTYKVYDIKYWEFIVNSSIKFSMFVELKSYVYFLKNVKYQKKNFYINAWQNLIENNFVFLKNFSEVELERTLINNFLMIQSCPVVYSLNFENIYKKCIEIEKPAFAGVLLQYVSEEMKDKMVKELINNSDKKISQDLKKLAQEGITGTPYVEKLLSSQN